MSESSVLIILHLSSLIHIDVTLSIWRFFAAAVVVQLSNRRAILIWLVAHLSVANPLLGHIVFELSLIR